MEFNVDQSIEQNYISITIRSEITNYKLEIESQDFKLGIEYSEYELNSNQMHIMDVIIIIVINFLNVDIKNYSILNHFDYYSLMEIDAKFNQEDID